MYVPTATTTPTTTLRDFTVEHVRVLVPPHRAHTTALSLVSGMLPPWATTEAEPEPDPINSTLRWFGRHLFVVSFPETCSTSTRVRYTNSVRRCVERLADADTTCVLDVIVATTAAVAHRKGRRSTAVCGSATLSVSDNGGAVRMALRHMDYEISHGQLRVPFAAVAAASPRSTLDDLWHAVELPGSLSIDRDVPTIPLLAAGRPGGHSDPDNTTCTRFAHFAADDHDVWEVRPATVGADLAYDAHIAGLSDRAHYRVFEAWPSDPFEGV